MKNNKINGIAKWIVVGLAIATIAYNTIVAHVISRNDIKHLQQADVRIEAKVDKIIEYLMEK